MYSKSSNSMIRSRRLELGRPPKMRTVSYARYMRSSRRTLGRKMV